MMNQDAQHFEPVATLSRRRVAMLLFVGMTAGAVIGCAAFGVDKGQTLIPDRVETRTGPFAIYTNTKIAADAPALRCLRTLEADVARELGLRVAAEEPPVEVYILKDRDAFSHFLLFYHPELPPRRAFFLAQGQKRMIYTYINDRLEEDLRHEATHALLHATVGDLPLWLDEGLAECFEGPGGRQGVNSEHVARLPDDVKAGWRPDLSRLETLVNVREMTPRDYRESWAWVHFLLNGPPVGKQAVLGYLVDLRDDPTHARPLSARMNPSGSAAGTKLLAHLQQSRAGTPVVAYPAAAEPTILFQNAALEPSSTPRPAPRKSLFGRFVALFGQGN